MLLQQLLDVDADDQRPADGDGDRLDSNGDAIRPTPPTPTTSWFADVADVDEATPTSAWFRLERPESGVDRSVSTPTPTPPTPPPTPTPPTGEYCEWMAYKPGACR